MAAGSSMPTMFISVTSVFLDEGDIGLGTIIGSTMFNILFITGICGVATSIAINLKPYSIIRDSLCYVIYLVFLLLAMYDGMILWYEALVVSVLYGFYVAIMCYNSALEHRFNKWAKADFPQSRSASPLRPPAESFTNSPQKGLLKSKKSDSPIKRSINPAERLEEPALSSEVFRQPILPGHFPAPTLNQCVSSEKTLVSLEQLQQLEQHDKSFAEGIGINQSLSFPHSHTSNVDNTIAKDDEAMSDIRSVYSDINNTLPHTKYDDEPKDTLACPPGRWEKARWAIMFPIRVLYCLTIPDCRVSKWESWYIVTFVLSISWMGLLSYVLVWAVSVIGVTISIPECIMGLTLLAAGSSIPDAIASLVMAEQGMADMAIANAIGSNIFDILCLSMPWLLSTTVVHPNSQVLIQGGNIVYVSLTLFGTVAVTLIILYYNNWRLDRKMGAAMLTAYIFFLVAAVLIESYPKHEKIKHPHHRPDLPHKGLATSESHRAKNKIKTTGFTWN